MTTSTLSPQTLFRIVIVILSIWFLYLVRDVILLFVIAVIITAALDPIINRLERWHVPRAAMVSLVYIAFFTMIIMLVSHIVPVLIAQTNALGENLAQYIQTAETNTINTALGFDSIIGPNIFENIGSTLSGSIGEIFTRTASFFSGIIAALAALSMSFYMSLQKNGLRKFFLSVTPKQHQPYVSSLTDRIRESFGRWMAGQVVTMFFVGTLYFIALSILGVPYALVLSIVGGVLEIVPYLGPLISVIPAIIIGFSMSPIIGLSVGIAYAIINVIENHILIPQIMNKAVGLNPVAVILSLLIGAKVAGLIGVIVAVPIAGAISLFVKDVLEKKIV